MQIDSISFTHFRCFGADGHPSTFTFSPGLNIFLGENATGKTALLDGLVVGLGAVYLGLPRGIKPGTSPTGSIGPDDPTRVIVQTPGLARSESRYPVTVKCTGRLLGEPVTWQRSRESQHGRIDRKDASVLVRHVEAMNDGLPVEMPVLAYFGHGRLWDIRKDFPYKTVDEVEDRVAGYARALESKSDRKAVLAWWQRVELAARQRAVEAGPLPEHAILTEALCRVLPGAKEVWYDGALGQPMVRFTDHVTAFQQLSAGYQNILGIVLDLVYRVTRLNPHLGVHAARMTDGVVLIDEIDQHLHPKWQRRVLEDLRETFPRVQFILTTHAPQVLVGARPGEVQILKRHEDGRIYADQIDIPPGLRADEVLTGAWFDLPSTLDSATLDALEQHRQMLRELVAPSDPRRLSLEAELRRRLGRFNDTSLEGMALSVMAELTADRLPRTAAERAQLKAALHARLASAP